MDFSYSPEEEAFRQEVSDWLAENMKELPGWWDSQDVPGPEPDSDEYHHFRIWWHRKLHEAGFVGIFWPKEYGCRGATLMEQAVFDEEMARHRAPGPANMMGTTWVGPSIMAHGTEEHARRFLPKILSAEEIWCTLYSEPQAGSDMASAQTRAVEDGDDFVVNGQKVWTSGGHHADWGVLLARTDPDAPKHRGLSYFLVDMHSPGVTVRPLKQITGFAEFNETFLDNVRIPKHQLLGEKNMGWYVAAGALENERLAGAGDFIRHQDSIRALIEMAKTRKAGGRPLSEHPLIRQKLAQLYVDASMLRSLALRSLTHRLKHGKAGPEGSFCYVFGNEFGQRLQELAMLIQGPYHQLVKGSRYAIDQGQWQHDFLQSRASTIAGGTSEIQRNVIAQRVLGLPR
ncbi:MAG: acyl-CoA dehydrogenase family protein [Acidimicrobiia bacterium]